MVSSAIFSSMSATTLSDDVYAPVAMSSARSATSLRTSFSSDRFSARLAAVTGCLGRSGEGSGEGSTGSTGADLSSSSAAAAADRLSRDASCAARAASRDASSASASAKRAFKPDSLP